MSTGPNRGNRSRREIIADQARFLQLELWNSRDRIAWFRKPEHPLDVLEPGVALTLKGYTVESVPSLAPVMVAGVRREIAGEIDRETQVVRISCAFHGNEQRYTAAHELGHAILHPRGESIHRDRPMDFAHSHKEPEEKEADWFAAYFLMPERQVRPIFKQLFATDRFELTEDTAFALCTSSIEDVLEQCMSIRHFSLMLARAIRYRGIGIPSLASIFRVSDTAMAIRLEELGLVAELPIAARRRK